MAKIYTSDELLDLTRNRARIPDTASEASADADVLEALNEAMLNELVPWLMSFREEYFVTTTEISLVSSQRHYRIPKRAVGQKLRDIYRIDTGAANNSKRELTQISRKDLADYNNATGDVRAFYLEGNYIAIVPTQANATDKLEVSYYRAPGDLVAVSETRVVQSVDSDVSLTVSSNFPTGWTSGSTFDIHSPQSGAEVKVEGLTVSAIGSNSVTFNEKIDGSTAGTHAVAVGDYLCLENEAAVPGLPRELHPVLAQAAAVILLQNEQDSEALRNAATLLNRQLERSREILEHRVEARPKKIHGRDSTLWKQGAFSPSYY